MEFFNNLFIPFISMLLLFCYMYRNKNGMPTNWPIIGMLFTLLANVHRVHDFLIELLEKSNLTFHFKGPWFTTMEIIITSDPNNIHHVMSKNFANYPKGEKFNDMFDVLGDGIFNSDGELWKYHRRMAQTFLGHPQFNQFLLKKISAKVNNGLIPVLDYASKQGLVVDLQDLFERFAFDNICALTMGYELGSLCVEFPRVPFSKALDDVEEVIFYRHVMPLSVWKFMRWLCVGHERKFKNASKTLDNFIYNCIANKSRPNDEKCVDVLTLYKDKDDKFLRDI
ncbi:hypothetical protein vseg_015586 [Gypsophila vaccaria]